MREEAMAAAGSTTDEILQHARTGALRAASVTGIGAIFQAVCGAQNTPFEKHWKETARVVSTQLGSARPRKALVAASQRTQGYQEIAKRLRRRGVRCRRGTPAAPLILPPTSVAAPDTPRHLQHRAPLAAALAVVALTGYTATAEDKALLKEVVQTYPGAVASVLALEDGLLFHFLGFMSMKKDRGNGTLVQGFSCWRVRVMNQSCGTFITDSAKASGAFHPSCFSIFSIGDAQNNYTVADVFDTIDEYWPPTEEILTQTGCFACLTFFSPPRRVLVMLVSIAVYDDAAETMQYARYVASWYAPTDGGALVPRMIECSADLDSLQGPVATAASGGGGSGGAAARVATGGAARVATGGGGGGAAAAVVVTSVGATGVVATGGGVRGAAAAVVATSVTRIDAAAVSRGAGAACPMCGTTTGCTCIIELF
mgnify:CR=1 FL=1